MTRQLVLDTETTGLDPRDGHRVLEVAAIEIVNLMPTGRHFHRVIDPERDIPAEASRIHGFTSIHVEGKPKFAAILAELEAFLGDDPIIAHNAGFDFAMLDAELARCGRPALPRARMVDTLEIAKKRFPGMPNSLDALCRRLGIDNSMRTSHNALLDVQLLAQVYLELMGGRQPGLTLAVERAVPVLAAGEVAVVRTPRPIIVPEEMLARHAEFVGKKLKDALWLKV
ncbi:DNA polymerase III subunit epsilon [Plastoroseomonas hellenica]|uniref:DNA polymerase III subunit epsilon n=1 Tax=Plastoroseomonas hellenica TaxID=2687306 RepID=UPI001BAA1432|nr:DNA polymerase III subunit epsilon [Plastoroseomonas hellenica]MBR0646788.1 DNA polymerase III subunit epsilon [Plastoroseomonas hellenica]